MKKILLSLSAIGMIAVVAVAATGAFFTDTETSTGNTFTAGTFTLDVNGDSDGTFDIALGTLNNFAPGNITQSADIIVKNSGSVNAATFGRFTLSNASTTDLSKVLKIYNYKVEYFDASNQPVVRWSTDDPYFGTANNMDWFIRDGNTSLWTAVGGKSNLYDWVTTNGPLDINNTAWDMEGLKPGGYYKLTIQFQMDPNAGNEYQGAYVTLGYEVRSTQVNKDAILDLNLGGDITSTVDGHVAYLQSQVQ